MSETPHTQPGQAIRRVCGAKTRKGTPCQGLAMENGRCRMHGGNARRGIASPTFKTGIYSKHMPQLLGEAAWNAAHDPNLFDLRQLIGVYVVRIQDALSLMDGGGLTPELASEIKKTWMEFRAAQDAGQSGKARMIAAAYKLDDLLDTLNSQFHIWREVDTAAINLKKLMESERKRQIEAASLIPVTAANNFAYEVLLLIRREVTDPAVWQRVEVGMEDLLGKYPAVADSVE